MVQAVRNEKPIKFLSIPRYFRFSVYNYETNQKQVSMKTKIRYEIIEDIGIFLSYIISFKEVKVC